MFASALHPYDVRVLVFASLLEWVLLLVVTPIAQRLADFSMPPAIEMAWKLAVLVLLKNAIGYGISVAANNRWLGVIALLVAFFVGLKKVLDVNLHAAAVIVVLSVTLVLFINTIIFSYSYF